MNSGDVIPLPVLDWYIIVLLKCINKTHPDVFQTHTFQDTQLVKGM